MPLKAVVPEKLSPYNPRDRLSSIKSLIVDRDAMGGGLLADALTRNLECNAVACHSSKVLDVIATGKVDIVIISADLNSKPRGGFELVSAVSSANPTLPIVMLLDHPSRETVINAFRAGARGVFNRQEPMSQLLECVKHVKKGSIWADADQTNHLLEGIKSIPDTSAFTEGNLATLTMRELQVVRFAALGKTNKVIATELGLSEHTVKNYLLRAFEKLGVSSRVELLFLLTMRGHSFSSSFATVTEISEKE